MEFPTLKFALTSFTSAYAPLGSYRHLSRLSFNRRTMVGVDGQDNLTNHDILVIFGQVLNEVKADMKAQERENEFIGARVCA